MKSKRADQPYICNDLMAKEAWFPHEFKLAAAGIQAYTAIPLQARGRRIGVLVFSRAKPDPFTAEQMTILVDVSRAIAVAVANALANEEIARLRDQLEAENVALRDQLSRITKFEEMVGDSPSLRRALEAVEQVAATDATVLIAGETGTGKELIARAIHQRSHRAKGPLVKFNCAAIPETLLASELFGHERGAFTGAIERRKGRFEQAQGGTLFLDEIGELPPELQVMLLRVLQEREFERLGGDDTIHVDVRIVAATNRDLMEDVRAGRVPQRSLLPVERLPAAAAAFARAPGRHSAAGRALRRQARRALRPRHQPDRPAFDEAARIASLARQRARTRKRHRTGDHPLPRRRPPRRTRRAAARTTLREIWTKDSGRRSARRSRPRFAPRAGESPARTARREPWGLLRGRSTSASRAWASTSFSTAG